MGNRLFTELGSVNIEPTTRSQRDVDCHGNGGVVESNSDVQDGTAMSGFRDAVAEGHIGAQRGASKKIQTLQLIWRSADQ